MSTAAGANTPLPDEGKHHGIVDDDSSNVGMAYSRELESKHTTATQPRSKHQRRYHWVSEEAERLIADAYRLHLPHHPFPPSLAYGRDRTKLEEVDIPHVPPRTFLDRLALVLVTALENLIHLFFWNQYDHHAMTLETVAAVPGMVAGVHRHLRSLRRMTKDHGWIDNMFEEAKNERMHMLIWLEHTKPSWVERLLVLVAQAVFTSTYTLLYILSPDTAHRMVGYMEEAAFRSYTDFLDAVDNGVMENTVVEDDSIASKYYRLPPGSTLRDVILHIRADEAYHGLYNHGISDHILSGGFDENITEPGGEILASSSSDLMKLGPRGGIASSLEESLELPMFPPTKRSPRSSAEFIFVDDDDDKASDTESETTSGAPRF